MEYNDKYFKYVVANSSLLIFGDYSLDKYSNVFSNFSSFVFQENTDFNIDNLSSTINEFNIDIIIITADQDKEKLYDKLIDIISHKTIHLILCHNPKKIDCSENLINIIDTVFTQNISLDNLKYKIYNVLNDRVASVHIDSLMETNTKNNHLNTRTRYRDTFDTEIMFICEELRQISNAINAGDLSKEVFNKLELNISKVSFIINGHLMSSKTIKDLVNTLDYYFKNFDLEEIDISSLDGFVHLSNMINDIAIFLDKYFITREMDKIYVIEDSLANSFEYVKSVFEGKNDQDDDASEMEFF